MGVEESTPIPLVCSSKLSQRLFLSIFSRGGFLIFFVLLQVLSLLLALVLLALLALVLLALVLLALVLVLVSLAIVILVSFINVLN
jgi:hypothetical protein